MPTHAPGLIVSLCQHRERCIIAVRFRFEPTLISWFRKLPGACWSQMLRTWYQPDTADYVKRYGVAGEIRFLDGSCVLDITPLTTSKDGMENHLPHPRSGEQKVTGMNNAVRVRQHLI